MPYDSYILTAQLTELRRISNTLRTYAAGEITTLPDNIMPSKKNLRDTTPHVSRKGKTRGQIAAEVLAVQDVQSRIDLLEAALGQLPQAEILRKCSFKSCAKKETIKELFKNTLAEFLARETWTYFDFFELWEESLLSNFGQAKTEWLDLEKLLSSEGFKKVGKGSAAMIVPDKDNPMTF